MERYSAREVKRAMAQEQLLLRLDQGEDFEALCQELGLFLSQRADSGSDNPALPSTTPPGTACTCTAQRARG